VTFGNAAQTNTTVAFSATGTYTLELSADDGIHAVAYDALVITVTNGITIAIARTGTNVNVSWSGGVAPYVLQRTVVLPAAAWSDIVTTSFNSTNLPLTNPAAFFRVGGQ
jgi:Mg/Co/Ni transporter MgtE